MRSQTYQIRNFLLGISNKMLNFVSKLQKRDHVRNENIQR